MRDSSIIPYVSLCSGYEGIGIGLHRAIPNLRAIAYCEREAFAIANLVAKMEAGLLDAAPVFTDVSTFPWEQFAPYMAGGILSFGWPCQPVSCAGKRKATEDERWLFDIIADGIAIMRPGWLFAENVEGLLSAKMPDGSSVFGHCITRLENLHYKVAPGIFSASETGAPHQRKRVFILAHRIGEGLERYTRNGDHGSEPGRIGAEARGHAGAGGVCMADASDERSSLAGIESQSGRAIIQPCNSAREAWPSRPGEPQHAWEPPRVVGDRNPTHGQVEPTLGRSSHEPSHRLDHAELFVTCDNRTDELRLLGNGVCPPTATKAFITLLQELATHT
jgi:site-specific DNA-cytosine methylase